MSEDCRVQRTESVQFEQSVQYTQSVFNLCRASKQNERNENGEVFRSFGGRGTDWVFSFSQLLSALTSYFFFVRVGSREGLVRQVFLHFAGWPAIRGRVVGEFVTVVVRGGARKGALHESFKKDSVGSWTIGVRRLLVENLPLPP